MQGKAKGHKEEESSSRKLRSDSEQAAGRGVS